MKQEIDLSQLGFWDEVPHVRKVGRYGFFLLCAFGVSLEAFAAAKALGFVSDIARNAAALTAVITFLALRDMSKQWDWSLRVIARAIEAGTAETVEQGSVHESADPKGRAQDVSRSNEEGE